MGQGVASEKRKDAERAENESEVLKRIKFCRPKKSPAIEIGNTKSILTNGTTSCWPMKTG
jgi:hypothetical protein